MREYTIVFREGIAKGLRRSSKIPKHTQTLMQAIGMFPEDGSLRTLDELDAIGDELECEWPFPQIFRLKTLILVCTETALYEYLGGSLELLIGGIDPGTTWSVGDFWPYIVATNGRQIVYRDPHSLDWAIYGDCLIPSCICMANANGQLIVGGPETSVTSGGLPCCGES